MTMEGTLRFENVVKTFGGTRALKGVSMDVHRGEVVALLGENGAGKSTLIKILGGIFKADSGQITIAGEPYRHRAQARGVRQSVAFIHQDLGLVEWMTVAENMSLPQGFAGRSWSGALGLIDWRKAEQQAQMALKLVGCDIDPTIRVHSLTRTEKSLVAIARALVVDCDFLVLDEPTASLPANEVERLFEAMRRLRARGVGMIYVSHRLDEIFRVADRVVVVRDGLKVGEKPVVETTAERIGRADRRPRHARRVSQGRIPARPSAPGAARCGDAGGGPGRFRCPQGRVARPCRPARRGPGGNRPRAVRRGSAPRRNHARRSDPGSLPRRARRCPPASASSPVTAWTESLAPSLSIRENAFLNPGAAGAQSVSCALAIGGGAPGHENGRICRLAAERPRPADRRPLGRQPAESRGRALARHRAAAAHRRRSDCRRRCRRQGGDLPADRAARWRRGSRSSSSPPISRRSPTSATARWCSTAVGSSRSWRGDALDDGSRDHRGLRLRSGLTAKKETKVMAINSIRSDALEPTRAELAGAFRRERLLRLLPVYGLPILTVAADHDVLASCCPRHSRPC